MNPIEKIRQLTTDDCSPTGFTEEQAQLYHMANAFLHSDEKTAERIACSLFERAKDPEVKNMAGSVLFSLLIWQERFQDLSKFGFPRTEEETEALSIYNNKSVSYGEMPIESKMPPAIADLPAASIQINGNDVDLLIDTGAMITTISESIAEKFGVIKDGTSADVKNAFGGPLSNQFASIDHLRIGGAEYHNKTCIVISDRAFEFGELYKEYPPINGTIGWEIIKDLKWTIDYKNRMVRVETPIIYETERNMSCDFFPMVRLMINNKRIIAGLDTGASTTCFGKRMMGHFGALEPSFHVSGAAGQIAEERSAIIPQLDVFVGPLNISLENAHLYSDKDYSMANTFSLPGSIGSDIAKNRKMVLDYQNRHFSVVN